MTQRLQSHYRPAPLFRPVRHRASIGGIAAVLLCVVLVAACDRPQTTPSKAPPRAAGGSLAVLAVTTATFAREVEQSRVPVAVDFWAPWCGPCRAIAPTLEKLAGEYRGRIKFCKVNVDENQELAARFKVRAIPTLIVFENGRSKDTKTGALREKDYRRWFDKMAK